ncbi:MAG: NAD(P)-dependent oxidoreductase [Candidatus Buchananbacteria bacterium]
MKLKILNLDYKNYSQSAQKILKQIGLVTNKILSANQLAKEIGEYDILIVDVITPVGKEIITQAKKLKIIATAATGTDHIDILAAQKQGIKIVSLKGQTDFLKTVPATAELTMGLLLALTRQIPWAFDSVRKNQWLRPEFKGVDLMGKTIGLVGFGRLGKIVAGYAKAFGLKVIAFDPYVKLAEFKKAGIKKVSLKTLLQSADIISLHINLTPQNFNFISGSEFKLMKKSVFFINTARGQLVDEKALLFALKNKKLAGAALDVLANENESGTNNKNPLINYAKQNKNLIITPHIGGMTVDSADKARIFIAQEIKQVTKN